MKVLPRATLPVIEEKDAKRFMETFKDAKFPEEQKKKVEETIKKFGGFVPYDFSKDK